MRIVYDAAKRELVLAQRALDIGRAADVFAGFHLTRRDDRHSIDEERWISVGMLDDDVVILVWTERDEGRRIVTMWKANDKERTAYHRHRDRPG